MKTTPKLYWVETGKDYLQIAEAFTPMEAVKTAFRNKEPQEAGITTEVRSFDEKPEIFYIDTIRAMKSIGFHIE